MTAVLKHTAELATPQATPTVSPQHAPAQIVAGHATGSYIAELGPQTGSDMLLGQGVGAYIAGLDS